MFPKQGGRVIPKLNVKFWWTLFIALVVAEYNATFSFSSLCNICKNGAKVWETYITTKY